MSAAYDPLQDGLRSGWKVLGNVQMAGRSPKPLPAQLHCDVAIVGSGAGAGISAELLSKAGLTVALVEEGPLKTSNDFKQNEAAAYASLYQECGVRKTRDKAIRILQGRAVGGSTTVNWAASSRTPPTTLAHWQGRFGLTDFRVEALAPYFEQVERRLGVHIWSQAPNENNSLLRRGANALGIGTEVAARSVKACANLGSCGMGCPQNANQSMLVTGIPAALDAGATLLVQTRADHFSFSRRDGATVINALHCTAIDHQGMPQASGQSAVKIIAKHYVLAGGAINSPAVLLRSSAPDPFHRVGLRSFLQPMVMTAAVMPQAVRAWAGAPQTVFSDQFLSAQIPDDGMGYMVAAVPAHPALFAASLPAHGQILADSLRQLPNTQLLAAPLRDGFHEQAPGGRVSLLNGGAPVLDYPITPYVMEGARRAWLTTMEMQFAAGADTVFPGHEMAEPYSSWEEARLAMQSLPMKPLLTRMLSNHVMGGCGMAGSEQLGVVRPDGRHWQIDNLSVHDGSLFPTSIGAHPQMSIYGIVNRLSQTLARALGASAVALA